MYIDFSFFPTS